MTKSAQIGLLLALASGASRVEARQLLQDRASPESEWMEAELPDLLDRCSIPGLAVALVNREGVTWSAAFGVRDAESEAPVDTATVFAAASLTKPVVAYAVLKLIDRRVLELDRPLAELAPLPDLAHDPRHARLTARMALSHTTGLPNWRPEGGRLEFVADPGERWGYSGEGFVLLARVAEACTGSSLEELTRTLVFQPLGMTSARLSFPRSDPNVALPHDEHGRLRPRPSSDVNAAASLVCSVTDYARFLAALLRGEGLSPEIVDEMQRPQAEVEPGVHWGLGIGIEDQPEGSALWQWGHSEGYRTFAWLSPALDRAFVFLSNGDGGSLLLRDIVQRASGVDTHPAVQHLAYESWDGPQRGNEGAARSQRIADYLQAWEQRNQLSGVVLAARGDELVFRRAYGSADVEHGVRNTPETPFHVASVTKTFTAAAILLLQDAGTLSLADPLTRFFPEYPRGNEIRLEHLLAHSSGIPDHHGLPGFQEKTYRGISLEELVRWQSTFPLEYAPGTDNRYVNSGYAVLARVVEVVAGESFPDFVRRSVLDPLGMASTGEVDASYRGARGYAFGPPPTGRRAVLERDWSYAMGSGSLYSNADDLLRWLRAVDEKSLVDVDRTFWPFGWGKQRYGGFVGLEQTGMHDGFSATISVVPDADLYVVHLSNLQAGEPFHRIHRDVVRLMLDLEVKIPALLDSVPWDPSRGARWAGNYISPELGQARLNADDGGLWWVPSEREPPWYLEPLTGGRFLRGIDGCLLMFSSTEEDEGLAPGFALHQPWQPQGPHPGFTRQP